MSVKTQQEEKQIKFTSRLAGIAFWAASSGALAADMLPLKNGIYVPVGKPCKGASNADMVNYWGGNSAIGVAQAGCTIKKLTRKGRAYTLTDQCKDLQSGDVITGGPTVVTINGMTAFELGHGAKPGISGR